MKNKIPMELLRAAIEEQRCEIQCDTLHELHGDDDRDCGDRSCFVCKVDALRKAADLVEAELDALKARALPEDMEWPTVDGIPVSFEERLVGYGSDSKGYEVVGVRPSCNWVFVKAAGGDILQWDASNCTRPILAADGEPLEVGQTVWTAISGHEGVVKSIAYEDEGPTVGVVFGDRSHANFVAPDNLTHERPVLDADGVPIKVGDTVYCTSPYQNDGVPMRVSEIEPDGDDDASKDLVWCGDESDIGIKVYRIACDLTHTKPEPDSWERIEKDVELSPADYISKYGRKTKLYAYQEVPRDLVRRAKKLAGVS